MDELMKLLPPKYVIYATAGWLLVQNLGRAWHGWTNAGGWRGIRNALIFGTNTPGPLRTVQPDNTGQPATHPVKPAS